MPAFILDLDGTLVDSVYQHVFAWHSALRECGFDISMWRLHRKIGMSGRLLMHALSGELGQKLDRPTVKRLETGHAAQFEKLRATVRPFCGAPELLAELREGGVPYAIATSGELEEARPMLQMLQIPGDVPIVSKADAANPKPDPRLFLIAAEKLGTASEETMVVGDSVWDMLAARRAHFLGIGLLTGGYGEEELARAGAYRVYAEPAEFRAHLYECGVRLPQDEE